MYKFTEEQEKRIKSAKRNGKEFLYIGHYTAQSGEYVLKVGTTDDLRRRRTEHNAKYRKTPNYPMADGTQFEYDDFIVLSKYNTLRYEENTKNAYKNANFGEFIRNDRFVFAEKPSKCTVKIKKTYEIAL